MLSKVREQLLQRQPRRYQSGTLEKIDSDWVYFSDEEDEAYAFNKDFNLGELEILANTGTWLDAKYFSDEFIEIEGKLIPLNEDLTVRILRKLQKSTFDWMNSLSDRKFLEFIEFINFIDYSIYDIFFCHFFGLFFPANTPCEGVNTLVMDNGDMICTVLHYFHRGDHGIEKDRFEVIRADGARFEI